MSLQAAKMADDALGGQMMHPIDYDPVERIAALTREYRKLIRDHFAQAEEMREQRELRERLIQTYPNLTSKWR